jgi:signal transduction histidine kinase
MKDSSKLLAGLSQEMRSQMNSIVGFSFLIEQNYTNENEGYSNQIFNSCNRIAWLFDSFLETAILDSCNTKMNIRRCNLNTIIDKLHSEFRDILKQETNNAKHLITEVSCSSLSDIYIDSAKLSKVIQTLFKNAVYNTKSGQIKFGHNFSNGYLTFYILEPGDSHLKYEEFLYTDNFDNSLSKYDDPGSAINIVLAKKIVHMIGGKIWTDAPDSGGTGMYFSIPVKVAEISTISIEKYAITSPSRISSSLVG